MTTPWPARLGQVAQSEGTILEKTQLPHGPRDHPGLIARPGHREPGDRRMSWSAQEIGLMKAVGARKINRSSPCSSRRRSSWAWPAGSSASAEARSGSGDRIHGPPTSSIAFAPVVVGPSPSLSSSSSLGASPIPAIRYLLRSTRPKSCTEGDAHVQTSNVLAMVTSSILRRRLGRPERDSAVAIGATTLSGLVTIAVDACCVQMSARSAPLRRKPRRHARR